MRTLITWSLLQQGVYKFNVDSVAMFTIGLGVFLQGHNGKTSIVFSEMVGQRDLIGVEPWP